MLEIINEVAVYSAVISRNCIVVISILSVVILLLLTVLR